MKFVFFLGVCLVVVFVVESFVEDESEGVFFEDEEELESRHHLKRVILLISFLLKMKKWSSQWTKFMQLRKDAWKKFRISTGFEPVTSQLPVRCSTNWALKPLTLGACRSIVGSYVPAIITFLSYWYIIQSVARQFKFGPETLRIVGQRWRKIIDKATLIQLHGRNGHYFLSILCGRTCCWQKGNHWALYTGVIGLKSLLDMRNVKSKKCFNCPRKKLRSFCNFSSTF